MHIIVNIIRVSVFLLDYLHLPIATPKNSVEIANPNKG